MAETGSTPTAIELPVGGMTCQGCVATITRGLSKLDGVGDVAVNLVTKRATVRPDGTVDPVSLTDAMRATIEGLGYEVLAVPAAATIETPEGRASEHEAQRESERARATDLFRRLVFAATLTLPLALLSMVPAWHFGSGDVPAWEWVALALATPVVAWSGWPFHRSTVRQARHLSVNMDTLVSVGTIAAWTWSTVVVVGGSFGVVALRGDHVYFETGAVIVTLILVGKWLEARSTSRAGDAIRALGTIQANTARLENGTEIARDELAVGMRFEIRPGETIATDGIVVSGGAAVDASAVTGESVPIRVDEGDEVIGGTVATDGAIVVEATRVGSETMIAQVARLVDEAQSRRAAIQRLADRVAAIFVPTVIVLAIATLIVTLVVTSDADRAFTAAVAVLIISCPCALGLATPLALMVGTGRGAQLGLLIRGGPALEAARRLDTVVLDKTGTVTEGRMEAVEVWAPGRTDAERDEIAEVAASAEKRSEHPVGRAVAALVDAHRGIKDFRVVAGRGVVATVEGRAGAPAVEVRVGSRALFDGVPAEIEAAAAMVEERGETAVFAGRGPTFGDGTSIAVRTPLVAEAVVAVRDAIKPSSADAVSRLRALGLDVLLVTGDHERSARAVASAVGIDRVEAGVLPADKVATIRRLQEGGRRVAMVGDGINDAPALAQADLGIALGTGTDVAREASDLTIVSGDLLSAVDAIRLARRTYATIRGNLVWAFAYNVAAIPLAAFGFLNPMIASGAMGGSSLFVVGNSLRLRGFGPRG